MRVRVPAVAGDGRQPAARQSQAVAGPEADDLAAKRVDGGTERLLVGTDPRRRQEPLRRAPPDDP